MNETYDVSAFRAVFERSFTWISGFLRNVRRFGEKTAVIDPASGRTWTYAALNRDANRLANALLAAGVGPGPCRPEWRSCVDSARGTSGR